MEEVSVNFPIERITSDRIDRLTNNEVFVFGSNIAGKHNGGAAKAAMVRFGAQYVLLKDYRDRAMQYLLLDANTEKLLLPYSVSSALPRLTLI